MPTASKTVSAQFNGTGISNTLNAAYDVGIGAPSVSLPAGFVVTAWVQTDGTDATCNLPAGHGYTSGNFDVYLPAGGVHYSCPGTISGNALTLSGGSGTAFPATATSGIVVTKQVEVDAVVTGSKVQFLALVLNNAADPTSKGHFDMQSSVPASVYAGTLATQGVANGGSFLANVAAGETNPLAGVSVAKVFLSNGSSTAAATANLFFGVSAT